ncbi:MAG: hypothetical protein PHI97_07475 [Desulfobulbus sp.]|nr:hypothetical protein [Desulfobulbus sp.]
MSDTGNYDTSIDSENDLYMQLLINNSLNNGRYANSVIGKKLIKLSKNDFKTKIESSKKYKTSKRCFLIPNKKHDGDRSDEKYFNIRNIVIYEDEARNTPCALYCCKIITDKGDIFYKIGITATRHAKDKSDIGLIKERIGWTERNFNNKGNGTISIEPIFIVKSSLFNCKMLENAIHSNSVFNQCLKQKYTDFSGLSECCKYIDFDHLKKLKIKTELHNLEVDKKLNEFINLYFSDANIEIENIFHPYVIAYSIEKDKFELDKYTWVKFGSFKKYIDLDKNDTIISNFRQFEKMRYLNDWIRLVELDQIN